MLGRGERRFFLLGVDVEGGGFGLMVVVGWLVGLGWVGEGRL